MSEKVLSSGIAVLLLLATLGEGGALPWALLASHGLVVLLLLIVLASPNPSRGGAGLAAGGWEWAFSLCAVAAAAGTLAAPYKFGALLVLVEMAAFAAVVALSGRCGVGLLRPALPMLLAAAAAQGSVALFQRVYEGSARPAGTFLNPNHLAAWLTAVLLASVPGLLANGSMRGRRIRLALAAPAVAALVLTGSRGALLGLAAGAGWLLWAWRKRLDARIRWGAFAGAGLLVVAVAVGIAVRSLGEDPFRYHRLNIWRSSLSAVAASPWLGTGAGQFATAAGNLNFPIDIGPLRYARSFSGTHSDVLRLPCEFGLPATLAGLLGVGLVVRGFARRRRAGDLPAAADGVLAALLALAVQCTVDNLSERPAICLLAAAFLGSLLSAPRPERARPRLAARACLAVLLGAAFAAADVAPYLAWKDVHQLPRGRLSAPMRGKLDRALSRNPLHPDYWLRRAEDLAGDGSDWDGSAYARAREAAERAVRLQPADARYRKGAARVEALACLTLFKDEATRSRAAARYAEAESLSRHDPMLPLEAAGFLLAASDAPGARRAAERALAIEPEAAAPRLVLAEAILALGEPGSADRARRILEEAEERASRWRDGSKESAYAAQLLSLDPSRVAEIRAKLAN